MVDESFREVVLLNWIYLTKITFTVKLNNMLVECHMLVSYCWLLRGSLFIELGCPRDLGKGGGETLALL